MQIFIQFLPFLFIFLFFIALVVILFISKSPMKKKMKDLGGEVNKQGNGLITVDGRLILVQYIPGSRNRSPEFIISITGSFGAELTIRQETSQDRFYKSIGLNREPQIMDKQLNDRFYFECDVEEFVKQLFLSPDVKTLVFAVSDRFSSIVITKKACLFKQYPSPELDQLSPESITEAARQLIQLSKSIPQSISNPHPELMSFKRWRFVAYLMGGLAALTGFVSFVWASGSFRIVDNFAFWNTTLSYAVVFILIISSFIYVKIRGFSTSSRVLIYFLAMFIVGSILSFRYAGAILNGIKDRSAVKTHDQQVIEKYITTHKSSKTYHVVVDAWRAGRKPWSFTVSHRLYENTTEGSSLYRIETRSGYWGYEWVLSEDLYQQEEADHNPYKESKFFKAKNFRGWNPLPPSVNGMDGVEYAYWKAWVAIMHEGIANRMNVQEALDQQLSVDDYKAVFLEYRDRQEEMLNRLSQLQAPDRIATFQNYIVDAGKDQIRFYEAYAAAKIEDPKRSFAEFRTHEDLKTSDKKLWDAYHYFQSLYPGINKAANDAIEQRLCWFDIV